MTTKEITKEEVEKCPICGHMAQLFSTHNYRNHIIECKTKVLYTQIRVYVCHWCANTFYLAK